MNVVQTARPTRIDKLDNGDWLRALLAEIESPEAPLPPPDAIARIRRRVHLTIVQGSSRDEAA